jgi:hypothetical protein
MTATDLKETQRLLEEAILASDFKLVSTCIRQGGDPWAFPEHVLRDQFPDEYGFLRKETKARKAAVGEISLAGLLLHSPSRAMTNLAPLMTRSREFTTPPMILRGSQSVDLLDFLSDTSFFLRWSNGLGVDHAESVMFDFIKAMGPDKSSVKERLCTLALSALSAASLEIGPRKEHSSVHQTFGFKVFSRLLLSGVDVPAQALAGHFMTFKEMAPIVSVALYHRSSKREDIIRRLIDLGADVNARVLQTRATPLMHAASFGDFAGMKTLIDAGADLGAKDSRNWTFRSHAKKFGNNQQDGRDQLLAFCDAAIAAKSVSLSLERAMAAGREFA